MPGHIFARLGMWPEDIASNEASVAASEKSEAMHQPGAAHQLHADEFLIYAYLQVGEDAKARALTAQIGSIGQRMEAMPGMDDMKHAGRHFDNQLRIIDPMEMHDWKALAAVQPAPGSSATDSFDIWWGHAIAAGHLGDRKLAGNALKAFDKDLDALRKSPYAEYADHMLIKRNEIVAWKEFVSGHNDAALAAMRAAADKQDLLGQDEVDIPAREMLGDLLMQLHRPQEALAEYKTALKLSPNRLNGLIAAGQAAQAADNIPEASTFYAQVARNTVNGKDVQRAYVTEAIAFNAPHPAVANR